MKENGIANADTGEHAPLFRVWPVIQDIELIF